MTTDARLQRYQAWLHDGTQRLFLAAQGVDPSAPSDLAGWTVGHVLTHVARNADALCNLAYWARTGVDTPMYRDAGARTADIEAGAGRSATQLLGDVERSAASLDEALHRLEPTQWANTVLTTQGRAIAAWQIPWLRCREVWVHAGDVTGRGSFVEMSDDLVDHFLTDVITTLAGRESCPSLMLRSTDRLGDDVPLGSQSGNKTPLVSGAAADLLAWLVGRPTKTLPTIERSALPALPAWL